MPRSHLHVEARPVRATQDNLRGTEWNVALSWQLRGLRGYYGVYMAITVSTSRSYFVHRSPCVALADQMS